MPDHEGGRLSGFYYPVNEDGEVLGPPMDLPWERDTLRVLILEDAGIGIVVDESGVPV